MKLNEIKQFDNYDPRSDQGYDNITSAIRQTLGKMSDNLTAYFNNMSYSPATKLNNSVKFVIELVFDPKNVIHIRSLEEINTILPPKKFRRLLNKSFMNKFRLQLTDVQLEPVKTSDIIFKLTIKAEPHQ